MPITDKQFRDLSNTVNTVSTTVARLEERTNNYIKFFWAAFGFVIVWLGTLSGLLYRSGQYGIAVTVSQLNKSTSPEQVKRDLSVIAAQVDVVQAQGKYPDRHVSKDLNVASKAVTSAMKKYPQYPETWEAASSLVNVRTLSTKESEIPAKIAAKVGLPITNQGNCFALPWTSERGQIAYDNSVWKIFVPWHDCTLYLDDVDGFQQSELSKYITEKIGTARNVIVGLQLTLVRVNIIYRGGFIIPVQTLTAYDCVFRFNVPTEPPAVGKGLIEALLEGSFEKGVDINVPESKPHASG